MEYDGVIVERISPKYVFKLAYNSKYIDAIEIWISMTNDRNLMSHTYDFLKLAEILTAIKNHYYPEIKKLYSNFAHEF
ncbi:MAG: nucleotidyltransferase substrate binding protein [Treponema phagedenis]|uniref:Uncharacterized protein n=1 Tax=Treponema phagedenis TaxID=162 RepID=A0A0B7GSE1_TREPH|nr:nucleotidyltransferase substrate binding protein [Treponema phagedenis]NVP23142.1 nucleotidyltransferase substrate binding protein [Treponema phagedenis]QEJ95407.1 hypothetical protein FUT79_09445 [Treponema phagedenis]QEJ98050.1 hypothetical protein FUT82_08605 [Treponema phagedenis]QEK01261.1 hypothetical protein FUT84_08930 [Treponema phagedenis]QEK03555.1 hypothetical protein FUT83_06895 [Treponema phagedenis]